LILVTHATFSGCVVQARPVGVLRMKDQGVRDEKILAVVHSSPTHAEIHSYEDLATHVLQEIEHFFSVYKQLEGKRTEVQGWQGKQAARKLIREAQVVFHRGRDRK